MPNTKGKMKTEQKVTDHTPTRVLEQVREMIEAVRALCGSEIVRCDQDLPSQAEADRVTQCSIIAEQLARAWYLTGYDWQEHAEKYSQEKALGAQAAARRGYDPALAACRRTYAVLSDVHHNWPGRNTEAGQQLLCDLRAALAAAEGR